jgi:ankyrin repeat protein
MSLFDIMPDLEKCKALYMVKPECISEKREDLYPIQYAVHHRYYDCLKFLLEAGADCNTEYYKTPLNIACRNGYDSCIEMLILAGADVNAMDRFFARSPLHQACLFGRVECARILLKHGADIEIMDLLKRTPLCYAVSSGKKDCVKLLLTKGANVNNIDKTGRKVLHTAIETAIESKDLSILRLILRSGVYLTWPQGQPSGVGLPSSEVYPYNSPVYTLILQEKKRRLIIYLLYICNSHICNSIPFSRETNTYICMYDKNVFRYVEKY